MYYKEELNMSDFIQSDIGIVCRLVLGKYGDERPEERRDCLIWEFGVHGKCNFHFM